MLGGQVADEHHMAQPPQEQPTDPIDVPYARPVASDDVAAQSPPSDNELIQLWWRLPDWFFRAVGVGFFVIYGGWRVSRYDAQMPIVQWLPLPGLAFKLPVPAPTILVDVTYLLIVAGFCLRIQPLRRVSDVKMIVVSMTGAFLPFLPIVIGGWLEYFVGGAPADQWKSFLGFAEARVSQPKVAIGVLLNAVALLIEIWGYAYLVRSVSIVPEARELKVTGPYRLVRHPIYLGQIIAQIAVWLLLARWHPIWLLFVGAFATFQLIRGRWEDRVLEAAFGEPYRVWKKRTFWFV